jgi:hypothetical protein
MPPFKHKMVVLSPLRVITFVVSLRVLGLTSERIYIVQTLTTGIPTLVYNCAWMLSICKNARRYMGVSTTTTFVYDRLKGPGNKNSRSDTRRNTACPGGWMTQRRADGTPRCPEDLQPGFYSENPLRNNVNGPAQSLLWINSTTGLPDPQLRQMGLVTTVGPTVQGGLTTQTWRKVGAMFTCDEFPAAR